MATITLNGVSSTTIQGLLIQELPPISKPKIRTMVEEVDGRDGDIITKLGYSAYDKEIKIGLTRNYDIDAVIKYFDSEGTVVFSNEPDKYYNYQILDQIDFEKLLRFKEAKVKLHCQPFKHKVNEQTISIVPETTTESGAIVSFESNVGTVIRSLIADIVPKQSGSGDPSPSNVRPISGWDEVNVNALGKNLFDADTWTGGGQTAWTKNGENNYTFAKNGTGSANRISNRGEFTVPAGEYYLSFKADRHSSSISVRLYSNGAYGTAVSMSYADGHYYRKLTVPEGTTGIQIFYANNSTGVGESVSVSDVQIELGTTASAYEPYEGETITTNLGQTVYGGTLDVVSGELTSYPYYSSYSGQTLNGEWICDRAVYSQGTTPPTGSQVVDMSGTGTEIQLTPTEVSTLLGSNNIWADSGDVEVEIVNTSAEITNDGNALARPTLDISGSGQIGVYLNGFEVLSVDMSSINNIVIDTDEMNAYSGSSLANRKVQGDYSLFLLNNGQNTLTFTGNVTNVKVSNYSRWL